MNRTGFVKNQELKSENVCRQINQKNSNLVLENDLYAFVLTDETVDGIHQQSREQIFQVAYLLGSVGKMLMRRERREWTARRTLVFPQVMHAAMPRCSGLKWASMAGDCSTVSRKDRISSPVQMLEMLACAGCSYDVNKRCAG